MPPAVGGNLNHWTAREVPEQFLKLKRKREKLNTFTHPQLYFKTRVLGQKVTEGKGRVS